MITWHAIIGIVLIMHKRRRYMQIVVDKAALKVLISVILEGFL